MDHHHDPGTGSSTVDVLALGLRLTLLLATAFLAGGGLLRPLAGELTRARKLTLYGLGGLSALLAVVSAFAAGVTVVALAVHVVLAVAVPLLLRWPRAGRRPS
ncbi:hypothetical protein [Amycolatopsis sp.]|uniref:hypothetical protein n=1 Tax=Amycolatopsis sp. TaxID=37632 RepID=UPI002D7E18B9|nr:hypothetical protein [Amycolatopsis sp.]HET6709877.1 hypothetical protein [Amycolatopsis sp.]